jgi:hypothetical protein
MKKYGFGMEDVFNDSLKLLFIFHSDKYFAIKAST